MVSYSKYRQYDDDEASRHSRTANEWIRHYHEGHHRAQSDSPGPEPADIASIPFALLSQGRSRDAARYMKGWRGLRRQVAHMAVAGEHPVAVPEEPSDRPRLGRGFDDDDPHAAANRAPGPPSPPPPRAQPAHLAGRRPRTGLRRLSPRSRPVLRSLASSSRLPALRGRAPPARRTALTKAVRARMKIPIAPESMRNAHGGLPPP